MNGNKAVSAGYLGEDWLYPVWGAPKHVKAVFTTRHHGYSIGPYASLNLGLHVGDDPIQVMQNRQALTAHIQAQPIWLTQVHGTQVAFIDEQVRLTDTPIEADAAVTRLPAVACTVMVADCLPVLLCDRAGTVVAAAHAGWRGLCGGVLSSVIKSMGVSPDNIIAALGPCIGPACFETGDDVRQQFIAQDTINGDYFRPTAQGKWLGDLQSIAMRQLCQMGVSEISVFDICTTCDNRFFSYRQEQVTGRFAGIIWIEPHDRLHA